MFVESIHTCDQHASFRCSVHHEITSLLGNIYACNDGIMGGIMELATSCIRKTMEQNYLAPKLFSTKLPHTWGRL